MERDELSALYGNSTLWPVGDPSNVHFSPSSILYRYKNMYRCTTRMYSFNHMQYEQTIFSLDLKFDQAYLLDHCNHRLWGSSSSLYSIIELFTELRTTENTNFFSPNRQLVRQKCRLHQRKVTALSEIKKLLTKFKIWTFHWRLSVLFPMFGNYILSLLCYHHFSIHL